MHIAFSQTLRHAFEESDGIYVTTYHVHILNTIKTEVTL